MPKRIPLVLPKDLDDHPDMTCHVYALATIERVDFATAFRAIHETSPDDFVEEQGYNAEVSIEHYERRIALLGYRRVSKRYERSDRDALVIVQWHRGYRIRTLHTVAWCSVSRSRVDCAGYDSAKEKKAKIVRVYAKVAKPEKTIEELGAPHPCEAMFKRGVELRELRRFLDNERRWNIERIEDQEEHDRRLARSAEARRWEELRREANARAGEGDTTGLPDIDAPFSDGRYARAMVAGLLAHAERVQAEARERLRRSFPPGTVIGGDPSPRTGDASLWLAS